MHVCIRSQLSPVCGWVEEIACFPERGCAVVREGRQEVGKGGCWRRPTTELNYNGDVQQCAAEHIL